VSPEVTGNECWEETPRCPAIAAGTDIADDLDDRLSRFFNEKALRVIVNV
jgi:hypothetical protein